MIIDGLVLSNSMVIGDGEQIYINSQFQVDVTIIIINHYTPSLFMFIIPGSSPFSFFEYLQPPGYLYLSSTTITSH